MSLWNNGYCSLVFIKMTILVYWEWDFCKYRMSSCCVLVYSQVLPMCYCTHSFIGLFTSPSITWKPALAQDQCFTGSSRCRGSATAAASFESCCNPVLQDLTLEKSFGTHSNCFSCLGEFWMQCLPHFGWNYDVYYYKTTAVPIFFTRWQIIIIVCCEAY